MYSILFSYWVNKYPLVKHIYISHSLIIYCILLVANDFTVRCSQKCHCNFLGSVLQRFNVPEVQCSRSPTFPGFDVREL